MENLYKQNGLVFWDEDEIMFRETFERHIVHGIRDNLKTQNRAFEFFKCEASLLTPRSLINRNYTDDDVFVQSPDAEGQMEAFLGWISNETSIMKDAEKLGDLLELALELHRKGAQPGNMENIFDVLSPVDFMRVKEAFLAIYFDDELVLRPETTMGSYAYARLLLNEHNERKVKPPLVVYQHGKSFRREQDQVAKNMRLKEFYQLEFQIIFSPSTKNDYSLTLIPRVAEIVSSLIGPCRVEPSDRLPDYAEWTQDIVCERNGMEVCSISKRLDFEGMIVLEVAVGTDRCVFNYKEKNKHEQRAEKTTAVS